MILQEDAADHREVMYWYMKIGKGEYFKALRFP